MIKGGFGKTAHLVHDSLEVLASREREREDPGTYKLALAVTFKKMKT